MSKPANGNLHYQAGGTWTGYDSWNAGDPNGAGTGNLVPLAGYDQNDQNYVGQPGGSTLEMGNGHNALFLDDNVSPGYDGGARLENISTIKLGSGDQLIDLTSTQYTLDVSTIVGGKGNDIILNNAGDTTIHTGSGNNYVWTGSGDNTVIGGTGANTIAVGNGSNDIHGGSGATTLDISHVNGYALIDMGEHEAVFTDPATGKVLATDTFTSIETLVGSNDGMYLDTGSKAGLVAIGGAGDDRFHVEGVSDTLTGGGGTNTYEWTRKFVALQQASGAATEITDFKVGQDSLNLSDFLKGQGIKHATYDQVVQLHDTAKGTMVDVLAGGQWHDVAMLDNVHNITLNNLGLSEHTTLIPLT